MGFTLIQKATGRYLGWQRHDAFAVDAATQEQLVMDAPPPEGTRWDGMAWVPLPPKTAQEKDDELQAFLDSAGGRVVKAIATVLIQRGALTLADIRAAYRSLA